MNRKVKSQKSEVVAAGLSLWYLCNLNVAATCLLSAMVFLLFTGIGIGSAEEKPIQPNKIRVAIIPWRVNAGEGMGYLKDAVNDMLASRIGSEPSIEIIKESSLKSAVSKYDKESITEDIAKKIGSEVNADYVVYGSLTVIANSASIDVRAIALKKASASVFFAYQSSGLDKLISLVDETAKNARVKILNTEGKNVSAVSYPALQPSATSSPVSPPSVPTTPAYTGKFITKERPAEKPNDGDFVIAEKSTMKGLWKSAQFATSMISIDIADVDHDKKNEIVMIDSHNLYIYRLKGQTLELVKEFKGDLTVKNYSVAIADINNNGTPEIYVTRMINDRLSSYVLEYKDNEFKTIVSDLRWFVRTVKDANAGQILIGQKYTDSQGYFGAVQKLEWKDGKLKEVKGLDIPKGLNLYDFEMADLNRDGTIDVVALDERDYLHIYNKDKDGSWKESWKSGEFYGGSLNHLELAASSAGTEVNVFIDIKARIVYADLDGDGLGEITISRNNPGTLGRYFKRTMSYNNGEIINLTWAETGLEENWKTKKIDGYIADYIVNDIDSDGNKELVILVVMDGGKGKSYVISYKVK